MQIFTYFYPFLIFTSVLGFHDWLLNFVFGGFVFMDFLTFLKHVTADCRLGCGLLLFSSSVNNQISGNLGFFVLVVFGLRLLNSDWFSRVLVKLLFDSKGKSVGLESENVFVGDLVNEEKSRFYSECNDVNSSDEDGEDCALGDDEFDVTESVKLKEETKENSKFCTHCDVNGDNDDDDCALEGDEFDVTESVKLGSRNDFELLKEEMKENYSKFCTHLDVNDDNDDDDDCALEDDEFDVTELRKLIRIERSRANAELEKERAAAASAAEEAMAMILRLQNEKSVLEMELNQYRRVAEEKQIHDQRVIQSLQWLLLRHESESSYSMQNLSNRRVLKSDEWEEELELDEDGSSSFKGDISDALENVYYSSRDVAANLSIQE